MSGYEIDSSGLDRAKVVATSPNLFKRPRKASFLSPSSIALMAALATSIAVAPRAEAAAPATYSPCSSAATPPVSTPAAPFIVNIGNDGRGGPSSTFEGPGHAGTAGGPGSSLSFSGNGTSPLGSISLYSVGGVAGEGSDAGTGDPLGSNGGGVGMPGGNGGSLLVSVSVPVSLNIPGSVAGGVCAYSAGGNGGEAGLPQQNGPKHPSGSGGEGGTIAVTNSSTISSQAAGMIAWSQGGSGGVGKSADATSHSNSIAGDGGAGTTSSQDPATGFSVNVTNVGSITSNQAGILAVSQGGNGGAGAFGVLYSGNGGSGASGGSVFVTNNGTIATLQDSAPGIYAQANGGVGGAGGGGGGQNGSTGGAGGNGGQILITLGANSIISTGGPGSTAGQDAPGILAQSFGGQGVVGGSSGDGGGTGGTGGDGGSITVQGGGTITTGSSTNPQTNAQGIFAQSIGGHGGQGGATLGNNQIGGSGGVATNGGPVIVNISANVTTYGARGQAVLVQSIGGGGGNGGDATINGKYVNLAIGGSGSGGGTGGDITAESVGTLETERDNSTGILLQSIGGGGGQGGAGKGNLTTTLFGIGFSAGGSGGAGGDGETVGMISSNGIDLPTNGGVILTTGAESTGILGQSIGGGGGKGGPSVSDVAPDKIALVLDFSFGGAGGVAGSGKSVMLANSGLILAGGAGSEGLFGQSVGGGGGDGGDASAVASAAAKGVGITITHTLGGSGGGDGAGGPVSLANTGLIITTGVDGDAMMGQSIGGGGGRTGTGDGVSQDDIKSTTILGSSGMGGYAGAVTLVNGDQARDGAIVTLGDGAAGMMAQSIDGGGGRVGGMAGNSQGTFSATMTLGATNAAAAAASGNAPSVNVTSYSPILTFGADAPAIVAQSIRGGGGLAGKGATSLEYAQSVGDGGNGTKAHTVLEKLAADGVGTLDRYSSTASVIGLAASMVNVTTTEPEYSSQLEEIAAAQGTAKDGGAAGAIIINLRLGATDLDTGTAGGSTQVANNGWLMTTGKMSSGIVAQAIGGGGGIAGVANTASSSGSTSANVTLGLDATGSGGSVSIENSTAGTIATVSSLAPGIIAQSVGGGGGLVSVSGNSTALLQNLTVALGGNGSSGNGGTVIVDNSGWIYSLSHDAPAIVAQSIGGGGGLVRLLAIDQETGSGQILSGGTFNYNLLFGAPCDTCSGAGDGGPVTVANPFLVTTYGNGSYGILAQSIGGGGGGVLGGTPSSENVFTGARQQGSGQTVSIAVGGGGNSSSGIGTSGDGAIAILAQSIGGGGGVAGVAGKSVVAAPVAFVGTPSNSNGAGGEIDLTVNQGATVSTTGVDAPAIVLQSIGGGGGRVVTGGAIYMGTAGGAGSGGNINVEIDGTVTATGAGSAGIMAQSTGNKGSNSAINITIGSTGNVQVGQNTVDTSPNGGSAGIYVDHGGTGQPLPNTILPVYNTVINNGTLYTYGSAINAVAIYSTGGYTNVVNNGTMGGNILLDNGGGQGCFTNNKSGGFYSGNAVEASCGVVNLGTIYVQGAMTGTTTINGNYSGTGKIVFDADFVQGVSDKLVVNGKANIAGAIEVDPSTMHNAKLALVYATGGITLDPQLAATPSANQLFTYKFTSDGATLYAAPQAQFAAQASGLGNARQAVAGHLQSLFDNGQMFDTGFTALSKLTSTAAYANTLGILTGQTLGGIAAYRYQSSQRFVSDVNSQCDTASDTASDKTCTWSRVQAGHTTQGATADALGYDAQFQVYEMGAQTPITDGLYLGGALAYDASTLRDEDHTAQIDGNSMLGAIGLHYRTGPFELIGSVEGSYGWYTSSRQITVGRDTAVANAKPQLWDLGVDLTASYLVTFGKSYLKPFAEVRGTNAHSNAFSEESTSVFALNVLSQNDFAVSGTLGAALGTAIDIGDGRMIKPFVSAAIEFSGETSWKTSARFVGESGDTDPFTVQTRSPGTFGRFGVGADLVSGANFDLTLSYNPEFGNHYTTQQGVARLTYRF
jgi:uncharacterized protein YhjY with autotransporter beta-barrel domain